MKHDIVYILKNNYEAEEAIYSIRSVCANFPYRKLWIYGGKPNGIEPDGMVEIVQTGASKWEKVRNTLKDICLNDQITEDFWLFNDDFFVMKKVKELEPMIGGTLEQRAHRIRMKHNGRDSKYSRNLRSTARLLSQNGFDTLDYAMHVPMLINREKAIETLGKFPDCPMFRSLYGNHHKIGGTLIKDVKLFGVDAEPTGKEVLLSTDDKSFREGKAGPYIRAAFPDKCKYEK